MLCSSRCGCGKSKKICPVSFGLALGITIALTVLIWVAWVIAYGPTAMMTTFSIAVPTWGEGWMCVLWGFIKGFIFGFFLALFYDLIACLCRCCRKCSSGCSAGCNCGCVPGNKPPV